MDTPVVLEGNKLAGDGRTGVRTRRQRPIFGRLQALLSVPSIYIGIQRLTRSDELRRVCLDNHLRLKPGERVLDIGCGPGYILNFMPDVDFVGFDTEPRYIAYARRRYGNRGKFYCARFSEEHVRTLGPFDAIMLMGVLHHIGDAEAVDLLGVVSQGLSENGRVVTLDPCFAHGQSRMARWVAEHDRGDFVRTADGYARLFGGLFTCRESVVLTDICRLPSTDIVHVLTRRP